MIYYKITYYNNSFCFGGQFLEKWQLKHVKYIVDFYFTALHLKKLNIRFEIIHIKVNEYNQKLQKSEEIKKYAS